MIKLLTLDLGIRTGYCIQTPGGHVLEIGTLAYESEMQFEALLQGILLDNLPNKYVVEPPQIIRGPLGDKLQGVVAATRRVLRQGAEEIHPGAWKGSRQGKEPIPKHVMAKNAHERDAYRMGRWWLITNEG